MDTLRLLAFTLPALGACAPATVQTPCVPNPVMMGPVTRIATRHGLPTRDDGKEVKAFEFEPLEGMLAITTNEGTSKRVMHGNDHPFTNAAVMMTEGRADRDVRVTGAPAGSWFFFAAGRAVLARWINFEGNVSEVHHAH